MTAVATTTTEITTKLRIMKGSQVFRKPPTLKIHTYWVIVRVGGLTVYTLTYTNSRI